MSKRWCQRLKVNGKEANYGLGSFPKVSLNQARDEAVANADKVRRGEPVRPPATAPTFKEATERYFRLQRGGWKAGTRYGAQWMSSMRTHAFPRLGGLRVDLIIARDVLEALKPIWADRHPTAKVVRQRIRGVLEWCKAHKHVTENVADERIDAALPSAPSAPTHHEALPYQQVPAALDDVAGCDEAWALKLCFRFLVLTAARSGEARGARWSEIDTSDRIWRIPEERMKNSIEHRQPLSAPALAVLEAAESLDDGSGLVFPMPLRPGTEFDDQRLPKLLQRIRLAHRATVHGFRGSFRTWASERTDADHAVKELALSHAVGSEVERAYARSKLLEKRRDLMAAWGTYASGETRSCANRRTGE